MACCLRGVEWECPCEEGDTLLLRKPGEDCPSGWTSMGVICYELFTKYEDGQCKVRMRPVQCKPDPGQEEASVG